MARKGKSGKKVPVIGDDFSILAMFSKKLNQPDGNELAGDGSFLADGVLPQEELEAEAESEECEHAGECGGNCPRNVQDCTLYALAESGTKFT